MLRLFLFRHAQADRPEGVADFDRPLSSRGRTDARIMGRRIATFDPQPDLVVTSPSLRTRETWEIAGAALGPIPLRSEPRLYETTAESALAIVRELDPSVASAMLVGHNPWMEDLARLLVGSLDPAGRQKLRGGLPTAAIAILQLAAEQWRGVVPAGGRLERLLAPER